MSHVFQLDIKQRLIKRFAAVHVFYANFKMHYRVKFHRVAPKIGNTLPQPADAAVKVAVINSRYLVGWGKRRSTSFGQNFRNTV